MLCLFNPCRIQTDRCHYFVNPLGRIGKSAASYRTYTKHSVSWAAALLLESSSSLILTTRSRSPRLVFKRQPQPQASPGTFHTHWLIMPPDRPTKPALPRPYPKPIPRPKWCPPALTHRFRKNGPAVRRCLCVSACTCCVSDYSS